jgi:ribosomal protein S18 acetylase RimI-like enzyme
MKIQKATVKDLKEISELFLIETARPPYKEAWSKRTALQKIKELFKMGEIYIVLEEKEIIGFIAIIVSLGSRGRRAHVDELWIKKGKQGQGIGKFLVEFIENRCRKQGIKIISLISDNRSKAFGFYKKLKYKDYPEDSLMGKKLK